MPGRRIARLNAQLRREIAEILRKKTRDPRIADVSVTGVKVTPDLWLARVYVRSLSGVERRDELLEGLRAAAPFIRRELGRILHVRRVPELRFLYDDGLEAALRIERILEEVLPRDGGDAAPQDPSSSGLPGEEGQG